MTRIVCEGERQPCRPRRILLHRYVALERLMQLDVQPAVRSLGHLALLLDEAEHTARAADDHAARSVIESFKVERHRQQPLLDGLLLRRHNHHIVEEALERLVRVVDAELLERVGLKDLSSRLESNSQSSSSRPRAGSKLRSWASSSREAIARPLALPRVGGCVHVQGERERAHMHAKKSIPRSRRCRAGRCRAEPPA